MITNSIEQAQAVADALRLAKEEMVDAAQRDRAMADDEIVRLGNAKTEAKETMTRLHDETVKSLATEHKARVSHSDKVYDAMIEAARERRAVAEKRLTDLGAGTQREMKKARD